MQNVCVYVLEKFSFICNANKHVCFKMHRNTFAFRPLWGSFCRCTSWKLQAVVAWECRIFTTVIAQIEFNDAYIVVF